ncbi:hypothetical protein FISHEDRAFT_41257 [Fistulina hepatica ATCC 64428]|nr:hypothetical protein FISHEDRAFT_41257 [Fistulina hepatica ATCC 64428]
MSSGIHWSESWAAAQSRLSVIWDSLQNRHDEPSARVARVGALDSEALDHELVQMLQEPLQKALSLINANLVINLRPEITLFLQLMLYRLSVWKTGSSYGAKLQELRYSARPTACFRGKLSPSGLPRRLLFFHVFLTILVPYLHTRARAHALSKAWPEAPSRNARRRAWEALTTLESCHTVLALANFVAFLYNGRYRAVAERLLKMEHVSSARPMGRDVSYEFMNRQMVWHAFTEFLMFLLPLLNRRSLQHRLRQAVTEGLSRLLLAFRLRNPNNAGVPSQSRKRGRFWALSEDNCAICADNTPSIGDRLADSSHTPYTSSTVDQYGGESIPEFPLSVATIASCGHIYCYHCLAEQMMRAADEGLAGRGWECLRCAEYVKSAERFGPQHIEVRDGSERLSSDYEFSSDVEAMSDTEKSWSVSSLSGSLYSNVESNDD